MIESKNYQVLSERLSQNIQKVIAGKPEPIELLIIALIAGGHVLIEDVPGVGKTTLVSALSASLDMSFQRIQFTPDLMPSDVTGFNLYDPKEQQFVFHPGAVMSHIVLADEINRSAPRTQSSLLEVMQEYQVTVDGVSYAVPQPFMVLATQNPIEFAGTYPLPEAQLDRFMIRISMGYPTKEEEIGILDQDTQERLRTDFEPIATVHDLLLFKQNIDISHASYGIKEYIVEICRKTREHKKIVVGASPRAAQMLLKAAKVRALLRGRSYVIPDDVIELAEPVLAHRLSLGQENRMQGTEASSLIHDIVQSVPVPKS